MLDNVFFFGDGSSTELRHFLQDWRNTGWRSEINNQPDTVKCITHSINESGAFIKNAAVLRGLSQMYLYIQTRFIS